jgi:hypothetical protein
METSLWAEFSFKASEMEGLVSFILPLYTRGEIFIYRGMKAELAWTL